MVPWANKGKQVIQKVSDEPMQHRPYRLQDVIQWLMVQDPALMAFLGICSARWKETWAEEIRVSGHRHRTAGIPDRPI